MAEIPLALLKKHVRADDFNEDDEYLQHLLDTAEEWVVNATNRSREELSDMYNGMQLPRAIVQAALMLAAHWYNQRESVSGVQMHAVPDSIDALIKQYRKLA
jgi:uncharacterized phage protein (predicted DNA packaging)